MSQCWLDFVLGRVHDLLGILPNTTATLDAESAPKLFSALQVKFTASSSLSTFFITSVPSRSNSYRLLSS